MIRSTCRIVDSLAVTIVFTAAAACGNTEPSDGLSASYANSFTGFDGIINLAKPGLSTSGFKPQTLEFTQTAFVPEYNFLQQDSFFNGENPTFKADLSSVFRIADKQYAYVEGSNTILGPEALPKNALVLPPGSTMSGGKVTVKGHASADLKVVAMLVGIAKATDQGDRISGIMKAKFGSDFGLTPPRFEEGIIGFGGYVYGANVAGAGTPPGFGISKTGRSFYGEAVKRPKLDNNKLMKWKAFLESWDKSLKGKDDYIERYRVQFKSADKAKKVWRSESAAFFKEVNGYYTNIQSQQNLPKVIVHGQGPTAVQILIRPGDDDNNLRIVTQDMTLNRQLDTRRHRLREELESYSETANIQGFIAIVAALTAVATGGGAAGSTLPGTLALNALQFGIRYEVKKLVNAYFYDANQMLTRYGYPRVDNPVNFDF